MGNTELSLDGTIDSSYKQLVTSIIPWEPIFGQDMNGDGDDSGNIDPTPRLSDKAGVGLGDADGQLYIIDGADNIAVGDPWIEESHSWPDGSFKSTAIAVELNDNGTSSYEDDDFYSLAVYQVNEFVDYRTGKDSSDESWQVYAIDKNGQVNWEKTTWTASIAGFESFFKQDLDGVEGFGVAPDTLSFTDEDQNGYRLKKDERNLLYIVDPENKNTISISDEYGGYPTFDWSHDLGYGSHQSSAVAVEQNDDGSSPCCKA